mmetsp:Transcript_36858/g.83750  ORF Transcript_36858/g.83750 Transcript_36858/m.83750 type:complete len:144 (-) Transcript_36858:166-597(-)
MGAKCCAGEEMKNGQPEASVDAMPAVGAAKPMEEEPIKTTAPPAAATYTDSKDAKTEEFVIKVRKTEGNARLGVDVDLTEGGFLIIDKVNDGLVNDWNKANPSKAIACGDKVVAVNGTRGNATAMTDICKSCDNLEMTVQRGD